MIPESHSLVTLLPERQAALQAIAAVEYAQQRGTRLARHCWLVPNKLTARDLLSPDGEK